MYDTGLEYAVAKADGVCNPTSFGWGGSFSISVDGTFRLYNENAANCESAALMLTVPPQGCSSGQFSGPGYGASSVYSVKSYYYGSESGSASTIPSTSGALSALRGGGSTAILAGVFLSIAYLGRFSLLWTLLAIAGFAVSVGYWA